MATATAEATAEATALEALVTHLHVREPWFTLLRGRCKTVEIRTGNKVKAHGFWRGKQIQLFDSACICSATVGGACWYPDLKTCLSAEGWKAAAPHADSLEHAEVLYSEIKLSDGTPIFSHERVEAKGGVIAVRLVTSTLCPTPQPRPVSPTGSPPRIKKVKLLGGLGGLGEAKATEGPKDDYMLCAFLEFLNPENYGGHKNWATIVRKLQFIFAVQLKNYMAMPVINEMVPELVPLVKQTVQKAKALKVDLDVACFTTYPHLLKWYIEEYGEELGSIQPFLKDAKTVEELVSLLHYMGIRPFVTWDTIVTHMFENGVEIDRETVYRVFNDDLLDEIGWGNRAGELRQGFCKN